ncbi:hypothetical protein BSIN_3804 [Burkholderia singularis]|uniref:Uncharacterized protein n=1 Tax=Burkholderia singularis TaxID=1503053 RepID=A0A238H5J5_9BURK|nr:hypothetical protein BSIN_3804 [Burkholderia singularis]
MYVGCRGCIKRTAQFRGALLGDAGVYASVGSALPRACAERRRVLRATGRGMPPI